MLFFRAHIKYLILGVFALASAVQAKNGNEGPHGGDYIASEFVRTGHEVFDALNNVASNQKLIDAITVQAIAFAILRTPVESVERPLIDQYGRTVDALTSSDPKSPTGKVIQLNRARWTDILRLEQKIHRLVFHEYLWVVGVDDTNYVVSTNLEMKSTTQPNPNPGPTPVIPLELTIDNPKEFTHYSISIVATDKEGQSGKVTLNNGSTSEYKFFLNPARKATINIVRGAVLLCIENPLESNVLITNSSGGTVNQLYLSNCK